MYYYFEPFDLGLVSCFMDGPFRYQSIKIIVLLLPPLNGLRELVLCLGCLLLCGGVGFDEMENGRTILWPQGLEGWFDMTAARRVSTIWSMDGLCATRSASLTNKSGVDDFGAAGVEAACERAGQLGSLDRAFEWPL